MKRGAKFDSTGLYRYSLWREWDGNAPRISFIMLNPSTADAEKDDATIRRCIGFAQSWGYGSLEVVNLFAYRATVPKQLREALDPVGLENDRYLLKARRRAAKIVIAWGNWGKFHNREQAVLKLLARQRQVYCFGVTQIGSPRHPLYLKGDSALMPFAIADKGAAIRKFHNF